MSSGATSGVASAATMAAAASMPSSGSGRCLCGAVRFSWTAAPLWTGHCHCESCRRACSTPVTSFFGVADGAWSWTGEAPVLYRSAPGRRRWFCGRCGSQMAYQGDHIPGETHFYAASMDAPETYRPTESFHTDEKLAWLHMQDPRRDPQQGLQQDLQQDQSPEEAP